MKPKKIELAGRLERHDSPGDKPAAKGNYGANRLGITSAADSGISASTAEGGCATDQTPIARLANIAEPFDLPQAPAGHRTASDPQASAARSHGDGRRELPESRSHALVPALDFLDAEPATEQSITDEPTSTPIAGVFGRLPAKKLLAAGGGVLVITLACVLIHAMGHPARQASATSTPTISTSGTTEIASTAIRHITKNRFAPPPKPVVKQAFLAVVDHGELELRRFLMEGRQLAMLSAQTWYAVSAVFAPAAPARKIGAPANTPVEVTKKFRDCPPGLRLSGVITTPTGRYATINDRLATTGDEVNGAKVVTITDFSVEMELGGEHFLLGIGQGAPSATAEQEEPADDAPKEKAPDKDAARKATNSDKTQASDPAKAVTDRNTATPADKSTADSSSDDSSKAKSKAKRKPIAADAQ